MVSLDSTSRVMVLPVRVCMDTIWQGEKGGGDAAVGAQMAAAMTGGTRAVPSTPARLIAQRSPHTLTKICMASGWALEPAGRRSEVCNRGGFVIGHGALGETSAVSQGASRHSKRCPGQAATCLISGLIRAQDERRTSPYLAVIGGGSSSDGQGVIRSAFKG
jgi:hypothetical protein